MRAAEPIKIGREAFKPMIMLQNEGGVHYINPPFLNAQTHTLVHVIVRKFLVQEFSSFFLPNIS